MLPPVGLANQKKWRTRMSFHWSDLSPLAEHAMQRTQTSQTPKKRKLQELEGPQATLEIEAPGTAVAAAAESPCEAATAAGEQQGAMWLDAAGAAVAMAAGSAGGGATAASEELVLRSFVLSAAPCQ